MAANLYRIKQASRPAVGQELLDVLSQINDAFARLKLIRLAMIQEEDDANNNDASFTTVANQFGFVASDGTTITPSVAHAAFLEIDSFVSNGGPSLEQCCARFKQ